MQEFFKTTLECKLIQNILFSTPLPVFKTINDGDYILQGKYYIYKTYIIKCLTSGTFKKNATYKIISDKFIFKKDIKKITDTFVPKNNYYDTETHERLGKYLRCIRDLLDIDLMPFYNCFSEHYSKNNYIGNTYDSSGELIGHQLVNESNSDYKVVKIPINYNQTYTIAVNCPSKVIISPALLVNDNPISWGLTGEESDKTALLTKQYMDSSNIRHTYNTKIYASLFFDHPIQYKVEIPPIDPTGVVGITEAQFNSLAQLEDQLFLLIQLPVENESSIVVLEGDYSEYGAKPHMCIDNEIASSSLNKYCLFNLSLLRVNTNKNIPYTNRLLENLLLNVINDLTTLDNNIYIAQQKANVFNKLPIAEGVWDNRFRYFLWNRYLKTWYTNKNDTTGFIDKDVASWLKM